ncbi:thiol reductant ABC exporter subunit CydD [Lactococcus lactis]|jgi:ATP-binding cassette, subfamily C, bacterial CydD|uniref:Thiol reductant ABC exporter subunit CydD n=2 Tax=Lactococcus lactis TaxID=1358 RepID=A0A552Z793_9LACT|nr:thiol reductant ABC exporter subunit CydD [Lactococcus lactis]MDT3325505.1 thiol reductant ABC exporter subunit CydD [Bacillota bacterium]KST78951.1 Transport ATP-binding protein CydC [Lactococcus lactis subsp. lactis]MBR8682238.1 thiol reductant ABC exporter subunit CydD [Lactococcus lactis subsp. lactis]MBR8687462.1 thiol reductant ABC exporter subunit CydD [Lactococcus lactis subsp. lactis]MBS3730398.1 thiol reductant ABC exporter subunit CydD [Lactococcus lactis subsp. lactis]
MIDKSLFELPGVRRMFPILGILAVFQFIAIAGQALFLATAITKLWQGQLFSHTIPWVLGFFACFLSREIINFGRSKALDKLAYQLATKLRGDMLDKFFRLGPVAIANLGSGSAATTVITGIDQVENYIKLVLSKVLNMMIIPMLILIPVYFLDWQSGIVLTLTFPFAIIFMILLGYAAQGRAERQYKTFQYLSNHFLDSLRGISTLKYFGLSKDYSNSIYKTSEDFRKETMGALRIAMLSTFALDFFASLSVAVVALFLGLRLMSGDILLFPALAALILAPEYFLPLRDFASDYHATLNGKNALAAVNEVLSTEENTLSVLTEKVTWSANSQLQLTELGKIYDTGRGISNVNLSVNGFKKIAIVGNSGSGKSTLLSMLAGFLKPTAGEIKLNEQSLTSLTDENYRQSVQFIPQKTYIFAGTFRENLAFYEPDSTDDEIKAAAKLAGLESLIDEIGLDGQIGASGRTISGGQAQRVALARAFLSHTRNILFLDEPTAHLDIETELEIKANILPLLENKLVFIATHRLHWLSSMDLVIVLNEGQVAGIGTPEQLLSENTYYQKLLSQMRGVDDDKNLLDNETSKSVKDQEEKVSERSNFSSVNDKSTDSSVSQASSDNGGQK